MVASDRSPAPGDPGATARERLPAPRRHPVLHALDLVRETLPPLHPGGRPVILQLSGVRYLDSAGFSALDRLLAEDEIVIVLAPDSFMYRVAELMCMPIHHDAKAARRSLHKGAS